MSHFEEAMNIDLTKLVTENRNPNSEKIDILSTYDMLKVINNEDKKIALAIEQTLPEIALAVDAAVKAFKHGGRLIYCGAGTSGRLGILDASECPPTFGVPAEQVIGLIAGGHKAILQAVENAEDNRELAIDDVKTINLNKNDLLVGIAASGRTPYVLAAMEYALSQKTTVVCISCNQNSPMSQLANISITPVVGPEIVTGSSRMKAGTAQKLVLNMISTGAMIRSGKVFGNLMVDVQATNSKLLERQKNIVMEATGFDETQAAKALKESDNHCKTAILMLLTGLDAQTAHQKLEKHQGFIRQALDEMNLSNQ
jgi:N-acetylmuramic acid 6-phosphate etherase